MGLLAVFLAGICAPGVHAEAETDEDILQHDMFEFEASINHNNIVDGTEGFDDNDEPGNDSGPNNGIIRSWDTATYPVMITVNPKQADMLQNIELRLTGELENGITGERVNAKFAIGGDENLDTGVVSFEQDYTIEQTGNSIMIPVTIEVLGAKHGVELTPDIQVQVVSVDGENIESDGVITHFDNLPGITTSAKVSIKPIVASGLAGQGMPFYPYASIQNDLSIRENTHAFALSWGIVNLPGKSNIRGATFPDPEGKINFKIDLTGEVAWDNPALREPLDFEGRDAPFLILDHRPISTTRTAVGSPFTVLDGESYSYSRSNRYSAPLSQLSNPNQSHHSVWDSGDWQLTSMDEGQHAVSYEGFNTDYVIGSTFPRNRADGYVGRYLYGVDERVFSSHSFLVLMPNEYRIGGPNNPEGRANNVNYRATVTMLSYTDENGVTTDFENQRTGSQTFTERNNPSGSFSVNKTFHAHPAGGELGTPNVGDRSVSKGDASTLIGEDVRIVSYSYPRMTLYGGYRNVYRWNTDAFEMTKAYADWSRDRFYSTGYRNIARQTVTRDTERQHIYYGVQKFDDNSFESFTSKGKDDYDWYETYEEAVEHGPIGAIMNDVTAVAGAGTTVGVQIPLRVKHENIGIGSETYDGTANVAVTNFYAYPDEDREREVDVSANRAYHNPAIWDETGTMLEKQTPSGGSINFETLAVVPADTASQLSTDKTSYYNSETITWTARNSIVLPESGVPDDLDAGVTVRHTLPQGLDYRVGSGKIGDVPTDPEVTTHSNGTKTLTWELLVSNRDHSIPGITFDTTINPFALSSSGVQSSVEVKSVIESELDRRPENLRTSTTSATILKVGMVGIYQSIDKTHGDKNSDYTVTLSPYTTIEDESGVTGLTVIPLSGDDLGSNYSGTATMKSLSLIKDRRHEDKDVKIYLNRSPVYDNRPHEIDASQGGWYEYTGEESELEGAVSLLFYVEGLMTNHDDIRINIGIQTEGNEFGDRYLSETVINSDTNYRLSPISNRVRYTIRADLELRLERFQVFTNKASKGLPTSVRVAQVVLDGDSVKDLPITLAIYDTDSGDKVTEKEYLQRDLQRENGITIPSDGLEPDQMKNYEVRIEGYDTDKIWVRDGEGSIDTNGHTSREETLTLDDADSDGNIVFRDVVMTERELGQDMVEYFETLTVYHIDNPSVKAGYGFELTAKVEYENDVMNEVRSRVEGVAFESDIDAAFHHKLFDPSLEFYDSDASYSGDDSITIPLLRDGLSPGVNRTASDYQLPHFYLEQGSGLTYTANQKESGELLLEDAVDAGHRLLVPVWIDDVGEYGMVISNTTPFGSHFMNFEIDRLVDVRAYMFHHTDSVTPDDDELLIHPMIQNDIPEDWDSGE
ncbi:hypothetical protein [Evansella clarkii]|uniref:hypothetical protein n=1 Tax=Evansella clarkii TaxID=79879 RepID=UPI001475BB5C|nr:hypothetical protein [Evansella clarkii]